MKSEEIIRVITIHPQGTMKVGTKVHSSPSCDDIALNAKNIKLNHLSVVSRLHTTIYILFSLAGRQLET